VDETLPTIAIATIAGDNVINLNEARACDRRQRDWR